jgi:hypothetical protein
MEQSIEKEQREFLRIGTIVAAIYNVNRDPKRHPKPITAFDIFSIPKPPEAKAEPEKPSKAQLIANAERIFSLYNARQRRLAKKGAL